MTHAGIAEDATESSDSSKDLKEFAALATATLGVFTALAGGSAFGGGLDRISREYGREVIIALTAFTVATLLTGLATVLGRRARTMAESPRARWWRNASFVTAVLLFVAGLAFSFWAIVGTAGTRTRPTINVATTLDGDGRASLDVEIRAGGLNAHEYVRVRVTRLSHTKVLDEPPLYLGTQGPNSSGEVSAKLSFPLAPGQYDMVLIKVWQTVAEPSCPLDTPGRRGTEGCVGLAVTPPSG